jgi:hypothetical protein
VTLAFKTPEGKAVSASFEAQVRGMLTPRTMPARIKPIEADPPQDAAAPA